MTSTLIERRQLFELLWTTPVKKIAKDHGVRPADVTRAADKAAIPRPPNGYWTQLEYGKGCPRPPLPEVEQKAPGMIDLAAPKTPYRGGRPKSVARPGITEVSGKAQNFKPTKRHKLVAQTERALRDRRPMNAYGLLEPDWKVPAFNLRVCPESVNRTLAFLDKLITSAEAAGVRVVENKVKESPKFVFLTQDEIIPFRVVERVKREEKPGGSLWTHYQYLSTGVLELQFERIYGGACRWIWGDGRNQRIEDLVPDIIAATAQIASEMTRIKLEMKVLRQRREEEQRKLRAQELQNRLGGFRETWLAQEVASWHNSKQITEFADAAEERLCRLGMETEHRDWLNWVRSLADLLDPLSNKNLPWIWWEKHIESCREPNRVEHLGQLSKLSDWLSDMKRMDSK